MLCVRGEWLRMEDAKRMDAGRVLGGGERDLVMGRK